MKQKQLINKKKNRSLLDDGPETEKLHYLGKYFYISQPKPMLSLPILFNILAQTLNNLRTMFGQCSCSFLMHPNSGCQCSQCSVLVLYCMFKKICEHCFVQCSPNVRYYSNVHKCDVSVCK